MRRPPLDLDFQNRGAPRGWARWALLALAIAFNADVLTQYFGLLDVVAEQESRLAGRHREGAAARPGVTLAAYSDDELISARDIIGRIATPWEALFADIEAAHTDGAALTAIEPDPVAGTVRLSGEARDYFRVLNYVAALTSTQTLHSVHLLHHEVKSSEPGRPTAFAISASWKAAR